MNALDDTDNPLLAAADARRDLAEDRLGEVTAEKTALQGQLDDLRSRIADLRDDPNLTDPHQVAALERLLDPTGRPTPLPRREPEVQLVGICGRKGHGKDTIGGILRKIGGFTPIAFADPIKRVAMDLWGFTYAQVYGDEKDVVDPRWGCTPRHAVQQLGSQVVRQVHPETWIRKCFDNIATASKGGRILHIDHELRRGFQFMSYRRPFSLRWVITDVRLPIEADAVHEAGGRVLRVTNPRVVDDGDRHETETEVDHVEADREVVNDGTIDDLATQVRASVAVLFPKLGESRG